MLDELLSFEVQFNISIFNIRYIADYYLAHWIQKPIPNLKSRILTIFLIKIVFSNKQINKTFKTCFILDIVKIVECMIYAFSNILAISPSLDKAILRIANFLFMLQYLNMLQAIKTRKHSFYFILDHFSLNPSLRHKNTYLL